MAVATGLVLSVAQTLFAALQIPQMGEICSIFGYKSDLEKLQGTVSTIKAVLLDADAKQDCAQLPHEARDWVEKLKDAVYDVDDLVDEFNTIIQQQKQTDDVGENKIIVAKVRRFFSRYSNGLIVAFNMYFDIKKVTKKLDAIASDHSKFGFNVNYELSKRRSVVETGSFICERSIIGREDDKEAIMGHLLGDLDNVQEADASSFVTIVGIGGLGKTALAQLVYNDDRIKNTFELRLWVCVSGEFGMKEILTKMLKLVTSENCGELVMDKLQNKVLQHIEGKKYLLVLDDVWEEDRNKWVDLKDFLNRGGRGSRVLVTSRSKIVATSIGKSYHVHELEGLSEEDSWSLFKRMAFEQGQEATDNDLVEVGKIIVKKCASVPLSIRVIGTLLYGQDRSWWMSFKNNDKLPKVNEGLDETLEILRFSYQHLSLWLKSCFSYCALFPKDFPMRKNILIRLWSANGCIERQYDDQSMEDAGDDCFSILLHRCFFQDIEKDEFGEIVSCKVHDLMHDLAQEVAGKEYWLMWPLSTTTSQFDRKIRHLSITGDLSTLFNSSNIDFIKMKNMRTCLKLYTSSPPSSVHPIFSKFRHLRVLNLSGFRLKTLPSKIGKLVHLRYLDLSRNINIEMLPKSITKLYNLETLILSSCYHLKALPKKLCKLVNLRHLDIKDCLNLSHMPGGMSKMTGLHTLSLFVVGEGTDKQDKSGKLKDLKGLVNLRGELVIAVRKISAEEASNMEEGYLLDKPHLNIVRIYLEYDEIEADIEEAMWKCLQPNSELKKIEVSGYKGGRLPGWGSMRTCLPLLVSITISELPRVEHLPKLSQLCHLKYLKLMDIGKVEYMERSDRLVDTERERDSIFFPSLEKLRLWNMPELKGWWGRRDQCSSSGSGSGSTGNEGFEIDNDIPAAVSSLYFPRLRKLWINDCPSMTSFPPCPGVEDLRVRNCKWSCVPQNSLCNLRKLQIDKDDSMVEGLWTVGDDDQGQGRLPNCGSSLQSLGIWDCPNLKRLGRGGGRGGGGIQHLTALQSLYIVNCENLEMEEEEEEDEEQQPWKSLENTLCRLCLHDLPKMVNLPKGIQYLTALQHLHIIECHNLKRLGMGGGGGGIQHLTALQSLTIQICENLELEEDEEQPWKSLETTLSELKLWDLPTMVNLPKGIQYLTALRDLDISRCESLIGLPEWLRCLTSLRSLTIWNCPKVESLPEAMRHLTQLTRLNVYNCHPRLRERCRGPNGEDCPNIQHIPSVYIDGEKFDTPANP